MKAFTKYLLTLVVLASFLLGSRSDLLAYQPIVIKAVFLSGTDQFADQERIYGLIEDVGDYYREHYALDSMVITVRAYRCSDDEKDNLWGKRLNKFMAVVYQLHPDFKRLLKRIFHDPEKRPFREPYLNDGEEIGLSFGLVFKADIRRASL